MSFVFVDRRRFEKCLVGTLFLTLSAFAQTDPGVRGGSAGAGGSVPALSSTLAAAFQQGLTNFQEAEAVKDGLGPRFNSNSCSSCHAQPAVGGTSPSSNPQVQFANSQNTLPSFITASGPVREARYILQPNGTPDGGVHALFTIGGRSDQPSGHAAEDSSSRNGNCRVGVHVHRYCLQSRPNAKSDIPASSCRSGENCVLSF